LILAISSFDLIDAQNANTDVDALKRRGKIDLQMWFGAKSSKSLNRRQAR